jgi:hypothetical protein
MKNINLLPISSEAKERLLEFARQYKQFAKVVVEVVSLSNNRLIVRAEQKEVNGKRLTKSELEQRVRDMFAHEVPPEWKITISAVDFDRADIDAIDSNWVNAQLEKHSLKAKHLASHTGIDKSTLSTLLNGNRELTKWQKVAFYYFFKYYALINLHGF